MNNSTPQSQSTSSMESDLQAWVEYDKGFSELCPQFQPGQRRRRECSERGRQRLRDWLDKQVSACLKVQIPTEIPLTTRGCHPSADAVFSYVVRYRESN